MRRKQLRIIMSLFAAMFAAYLTDFAGHAVNAASVEVAETRSLGNQVKVPITVRDTQYLTSGNIEIHVPADSKGITLINFVPAPSFDGQLFRTESHISGNVFKMNFISQTGKEHRLTGNTVEVGHLVYGLTTQFAEGEKTELTLVSANATGRANADVTMDLLHGKIERKMPFGDVVGNNEPTAAGAIRVMQHLSNPIKDREAYLSADVDGDGVLTQTDAQHILDYITGKRTSFLAVQAKELDSAVLKSEYNEQVAGLHGREPYKFIRSAGSMPAGIKIDAETGQLSGIPTRAGSYKFTIRVTDAIGNTADREFTMDVIDSNIASVEKLLPINVQLNGTPELPDRVSVTYKDKSSGIEKVTWDPVDTSMIGTTIAKGKIGNTGFTVSVEIHVVSANYINDVTIRYVEFLNLHTIKLAVSSDVYKATINNIPMHYEGQNQFSLGSSSFAKGSSVVIRLYDKYGNLLETKQQTLIPK